MEFNEYSSPKTSSNSQQQLKTQLSSRKKSTSKISLTEGKYRISTNRKHDRQQVSAPIIEFNKEELLNDVEKDNFHSASINDENQSNSEHPNAFLLIPPSLTSVNTYNATYADKIHSSITTIIGNHMDKNMNTYASGPYPGVVYD